MKHANFSFGFLGLVFLLAGAIPTARATTVDLATLYSDYTATNGTTLTGTLADNYKISIADGATITLNGVTIRGTDSTSCQWAGLTCEGDAIIVLSGSNSVRGFFSSYPGILIPSGKTLTIRGDGSLDTRDNGNGTGIGGGYRIACGNIVIEGGTVTATGGFGAGIGGGYDTPCGEIRIMGGTVTATGGNGSAGIGGGYNGAGSTNGSCGDITIAGGIVTATGGDNGAGIGGGNKVPCGDIRLVGGIIVATGGKNAAGIGGGWMTSCGDITVEFGVDTLTATMGDSATPIGNGYGSTCGTVSVAEGLNDMTKGDTRKMTSWDGYLAAVTHDIEALDGMTLFGTLTGNYKVSIADGATVTLDGVIILGTNNYSYKWAGVTCEGDATIILSGANTVRGFYYDINNGGYPGIQVPLNKTLTIDGSGSLTARGIGGYPNNVGGNIIMKGGEITTTGLSRMAGIGGANIVIKRGEIMATGGDYTAGIAGNNIIIESGKITAIGGYHAAGISGSNIAIKGGKITATGRDFSAGIGGGATVSCDNISITGGNIVATGGNEGAGIGSGYQYAHCGDITITGGEIIATGGSFAAGIGGGGSSCGVITITGGTISATGSEYAAGIGGGGYSGSCSNITIGADITRVTATKGNASPTSIGRGANSTCGTVSIAENLEQIKSDDGTTLTLQPWSPHTITWVDDSGSIIDTTKVADGAVPIHAEPVSSRTVETPYRYVFSGWVPDPVAATEDAIYTATFVRVTDLSLLDGDWSPADGDIILPGETPYAVMISPGITVTIDGVAFSADGASSSTPVFADGGSALITGFAPAEDGTWTLEAYGDLASGTAEGVTADMVQVYAADTVEGLATASPLASGVTIKEAQNAVKTTLEVTPPTASDTQFFRVQFTTE